MVPTDKELAEKMKPAGEYLLDRIGSWMILMAFVFIGLFFCLFDAEDIRKWAEALSGWVAAFGALAIGVPTIRWIRRQTLIPHLNERIGVLSSNIIVFENLLLELQKSYTSLEQFRIGWSRISIGLRTPASVVLRSETRERLNDDILKFTTKIKVTAGPKTWDRLLRDYALMSSLEEEILRLRTNIATQVNHIKQVLPKNSTETKFYEIVKMFDVKPETYWIALKDLDEETCQHTEKIIEYLDFQTSILKKLIDSATKECLKLEANRDSLLGDS